MYCNLYGNSNVTVVLLHFVQVPLEHRSVPIVQGAALSEFFNFYLCRLFDKKIFLPNELFIICRRYVT